MYTVQEEGISEVLGHGVYRGGGPGAVDISSKQACTVLGKSLSPWSLVIMKLLIIVWLGNKFNCNFFKKLIYLLTVISEADEPNAGLKVLRHSVLFTLHTLTLPSLLALRRVSQ